MCYNGPMDNKLRLSIVLWIAATALWWGAFSFLIMSSSGKNWMYTDDRNHIGLYDNCTWNETASEDDCDPIKPIEQWLTAVRVLVITALTLGGLGWGSMNAAFSSYRAGQSWVKPARVFGIFFMVIAGLVALSGSSVYTGYMSGELDNGYKWGQDFIFTWSATWMIFLAALVCHIGGIQRDKSVLCSFNTKQ